MTAELLSFDSASPWDETRLGRIKRLGGIAVSVYIRGTPGGFRHASPADVKLARGQFGLGVVPNWESLADWFRTATPAQAKAAGAEALAACRELGFPDDGSVSVPFSFDYEMAPAAFAAERGKLEAAQEGLTDAFRATAYGQSAFIDYLGAHGFGDRGHWLMASTWGLPAYHIGSPHVAMVQSHHADGTWFAAPVAATDVNVITQPELLGAWWPEGSEYANMPTAQDIVAELLKPANVKKLAAAIAPELKATVIDKKGGTIASYLHAIRAGQDPKVLAAEIVKSMPAGQTASEAEIEAALRAVFADAGQA